MPKETPKFCRSRASVSVAGNAPSAYIEEAVLATLRRHEVNAVKVHGKDLLPMAGEYTGEVVFKGISKYLNHASAMEPIIALKKKGAELLRGLPQRPPGVCVGCPQRPGFSAMKVLESEVGKIHMSADIGCHLFSTLPPF